MKKKTPKHFETEKSYSCFVEVLVMPFYLYKIVADECS